MVITISFLCAGNCKFQDSLIRYAFPDAAVSQLCEEQQPAEGAQFAASLCTVRAMADYPMYTQGMAASKSPVAMTRRNWEQNRLCEEWLSENKKNKE